MSTTAPPTVWPVPPGCPPADLAGLQKCLDDVNNATAFISAILIDLINNNPDVAEAMIQAIEKSGAALPLLGVTNGTEAIAPQVGQYVQLSATLDYTATTAQALLSLGVLPAGDWLCWLWATVTSSVQGANFILQPLPAGFAANPAAAWVYGVTPPTLPLFSMPVEALTSGDSLIVANASVAATSGSSGTMTVYFAAKRTR